MEFRTFYDRFENKISDYRETIIEPSKVEPNLSLSLQEIFERWKRNQPLDIQMRNGQYDIEGRQLTETEEDIILDECDERSDISELNYPVYQEDEPKETSEDDSVSVEDKQVTEGETE